MKPNAERVRRPSGEFIYSMLSEDHQRLDHLFESVIAGSRCGDPTTMRAEWNRFEKELSSHLDLEEHEILPPFSKLHPEEAQSIRAEHVRIRAGLTELGVELDLHCLSADRVAAFIELLRAHARREEGLLYRWATHEMCDGRER